MPETIVVLSVDTEEDNWEPAREGVAVENIRELPRLQAYCDGLGVPVTYCTTYQVATVPWAAGVLRDLHTSGRAEVAAHLHPWNTPPADEPLVPRNTMTWNLPMDLQGAKIASLTRSIEEGIGVRPTSFRTGRFGLGRETTQVLIEQGYRVDSSVTPWWSWASTDEGPDFVGAPLSAYTLDGTTDPRTPVPGGPLLEIPLSSGYSRWPFPAWHGVYQALRRPWARPLRLAGLAVRLGVLRALTIDPEVSSVRDMLRLAERLTAHDVGHLSCFFHSPTLCPGLSQYARTTADVELLYRKIAEFVDGIGRITTPVFLTLDEAARRLTPRAVTEVGPGERDR
jgi:hypothetical protein